MKFINQILGTFILFSHFLNFNCLNFQYGRQGKKQANFERFNNTCGGPNQPIIFTYTGMRTERNNLVFNSTINVKRDILGEPKLLVSIERCTSRENLDTCEHLYDYKIDDYCGMIISNNPLWSPLFDSYEPKWRCPFKKGVYRATNNKVDTSALLLFPLEAYYWKVLTKTIENHTNNKVLMCLLVEARIVTVTDDN